MGIISVGRELEGGRRMMSQSEITTRSVRSMGFIDRDQTRPDYSISVGVFLDRSLPSADSLTFLRPVRSLLLNFGFIHISFPVTRESSFILLKSH